MAFERPVFTGSGRRGLWAWAFYDWANSAFPTIVQTFVFAAYFTRQVAADASTGTAPPAASAGECQ